MSTSVSAEDVRTIAALARLKLSDEEIATATRDLSNVLGHFSSLQNVSTTHIPESAAMAGRQNVTREDTVHPEALCLATSLLERAPATHNGYVKVPAVF